jgi:membrane protein CcdC involved in cytochrome C biogenesis
MSGIALPSLQTLSLLSSIAGATAVMIWRVRETRTPLSIRKIVIPPIGMATGLAMFLVPMFRVPLPFAIAAFVSGAVVLAWPLVRLSRLTCEHGQVMLPRSNAFLGTLAVLAVIRIAARGYFDTVMSVQQTASVFFLIALGMILRWRIGMYVEYRRLTEVAERG